VTSPSGFGSGARCVRADSTSGRRGGLLRRRLARRGEPAALLDRGSPQQAGRLREALERLVDAGAEGTTAAEATKKLTDALQRVGSERRVTSPLGVAVAQARRLEGEIEAAERRLASFAGEEARLRELEMEARLSAETSVAAQRDWIRGRIAQLDGQAEEMRRATEEAAELARALEVEAAYAGFPARARPRSSPSGGAAPGGPRGGRGGGALDRRPGTARRPPPPPSRDLRRSPGDAGVDPDQRAETAVASALRRRVDVRLRSPIATRRWPPRHAARRFGERSLSPGWEVSSRPSWRRWCPWSPRRGLPARMPSALWGLAAVAVLGGAAAAALTATGRHGPAALVGAGCLLLVAALAGWGIFAFRSASRARSELAGRLPGMDLSPQVWSGSEPACRRHAASRRRAGSRPPSSRFTAPSRCAPVRSWRRRSTAVWPWPVSRV